MIDAADGSATGVCADGSASWDCFADVSRYDELTVPFLKRAQIAAADLHRAGGARFTDLDRLTMFADNLVPHVLRLDGVLAFDPELVARIEAEQLIAHAVARGSRDPRLRAARGRADRRRRDGHGRDAHRRRRRQLLWNRGQQPRYKAVPRHRSRCTAY